MKEFEVFVQDSALPLVFIGFVFGLFLVAVFLAWLSWKNSRINERERRLEVMGKFMMVFSKSLNEKLEANKEKVTK